MSNKTGKILGGMVLAPFVLIVLGIAYCEANKAYWDHKVKEMCEKDGGVTVFERVEISKSNYPDIKIASNGDVILPSERYAKNIDPFLISYKDELIINSFPKVWRDESYLIRISDNKILARRVNYARSGGDFPDGISHQSSFTCKEVEGFKFDVLNSVISIKR